MLLWAPGMSLEGAGAGFCFELPHLPLSLCSFMDVEDRFYTIT